jgi:hypothetical protein
VRSRGTNVNGQKDDECKRGNWSMRMVAVNESSQREENIPKKRENLGWKGREGVVDFLLLAGNVKAFCSTCPFFEAGAAQKIWGECTRRSRTIVPDNWESAGGW